MNPQDFIVPLLMAVVEGDLVGVIFRAVLPAGSSFDVPIERYAYNYGPLTATFCPGGCVVRITVRSVSTRSRTRETQLPLHADVDLEVAVVGTFPLTTSLGDLRIDVNTGRGRSHLRLRLPVVIGASSTPRGYFRLRSDLVPLQVAAFGVSVDVGEVTTLPGHDIEDDDLRIEGTSTAGRWTAAAINAYKAELLSWLRAEARYQMNKAICERLGSVCPARPRPQPPQIRLRIPSAVPWVASLSATALILWLASRKRPRYSEGA